MRKTFKYRRYPTPAPHRRLEQQLEECRWLYNHLLAERRHAWEQRQESVRLQDQHATLPALKAQRPSLAGMPSQVLQQVAVRIDLACKAFLRRCAAGEAPGQPRFRGKARDDSSTFPQVPVGCKLEAGTQRLQVLNVGQVKVLQHRPVAGTPKTATIRRTSTGNWQVALSCEGGEPTPLPKTSQQAGIDVGLKTFATLSTADAVANPCFFRPEETALAKAQRRLGKEEKGTSQRATRRRVGARVYERSTWRRSDFAHQHSRRIVNTFDVIAGEDLSVTRMGHHHCLTKSIHDAAWRQFADLLSYTGSMGRSKVCGGEPRVYGAGLLTVRPSPAALSC